ncbi:MAG: ATP-dependent DNA helicase [Anaerolineae bacterium]
MSSKRVRREWEAEREQSPRRSSGPPPPGFRPDLPDEPPPYLLEAEWSVPARPPRYEPEPPAPWADAAAPGGPAQPDELWPPSIDEPGHAAQGQDLDKPIDCPPVAGIFQAGGQVAQLLGERYRPRQGQIDMAELVRNALNQRRHAAVEAGTGIGKSFAYLAPAIWSGAKAVVSTSNKALMSQLWRQDLPDLQRIAPRPFSVALLKGRSNYLCNLRAAELLRQGQLAGVADDVERVQRGLAAVPSGDVEEMGLPFPLRQRLTVSHRECGGRKCPLFDECFYEQAKVEAAAADIIVTNHALLCFSTLRSDNKILPLRPILVVDEAHELPGYAISALAQELELETLAAVANHPVTQAAVPASIRQAAMEHNGQFFAALLERRPQRWSERWVLEGEIQEGIRLGYALDELLRKLTLHKAGSGEGAELELAAALRRRTGRRGEGAVAPRAGELRPLLRDGAERQPPGPGPPDRHLSPAGGGRAAQAQPVRDLAEDHQHQRDPQCGRRSGLVPPPGRRARRQRAAGPAHCQPLQLSRAGVDLCAARGGAGLRPGGGGLPALADRGGARPGAGQPRPGLRALHQPAAHGAAPRCAGGRAALALLFPGRRPDPPGAAGAVQG